MAGSILMGHIPDYAPTIMKPNMIHLTMSQSDEELIQSIKDSVDHYSTHVHKQTLGDIFNRAVSLYANDDEFIEDMIYFTQTKIKSTRLQEFTEIIGYQEVESLDGQYAKDY